MKFVTKKKFNNKYFLLLLQLVVMAVLFVFVFDKQAVLLLKDSLSRLQLSAGFERLIFEILCGFKMLVHTPSFVATVFFVIPIIYMASNIEIIKTVFISYKETEVEPVNIVDYRVEGYQKLLNYSYLENSRLLF